MKLLHHETTSPMQPLITVFLALLVCMAHANASNSSISGSLNQSLTHNDNIYLEEQKTKANTYQVTPKLTLKNKYLRGERNLHISNRLSKEHARQTTLRSLLDISADITHSHSMRAQSQANASFIEGLIKDQADEDSGDFTNNQKFQEHKLNHRTSYTTSPTQTLKLNISALNKRYDSSSLNDYQTAAIKLGSSWSASKTISIEANLTLDSTRYVEKTNIRKNSLDFSTAIQHSLKQRSDATIGYADSKSSTNTQTWYGSASHSYQGDIYSVIFTAARNVSASGIGLEQITDKINGVINWQTSSSTRLTFEGSARHSYAQPEFGYFGKSTVDISSSFSHQINKKWQYSLAYQHRRFDGKVGNWHVANKLVFTLKYNQDLYKF